MSTLPICTTLGRWSGIVLILAGLLVGPAACAQSGPNPDEPGLSVLVYSKTAGYRHASIPDGIAMIRALGDEEGWQVDATEDPTAFRPERLDRYDVIVFLSTTQNVLEPEGERALQAFIRAGGGFVGIHAASDTEYEWPWYGELVGAYFKSHPKVQEATVRVEDASHLSTRMLPETWVRRDEWYDFQSNPRGTVQVLLTLDESTYEDGGMGDDHPIAWYHAFDGGRSWYTGGGHTAESYQEPLFREHVRAGIQWAAGASSEDGASSE